MVQVVTCTKFWDKVCIKHLKIILTIPWKQLFSLVPEKKVFKTKTKSISKDKILKTKGGGGRKGIKNGFKTIFKNKSKQIL